MLSWWQKPHKNQSETKSDHYNRQLHSQVKYTKTQLNWNQKFKDYANSILNSGGDSQCLEASKVFTKLSLEKDIVKKYEETIGKCVLYLSDFTTAAICSTCDPFGSTKFDLVNQVLVLNNYVIHGLSNNCLDSVVFNQEIIFPYIKALGNFVRCSYDGKFVPSRPEYFMNKCGLSDSEIQNCQKSKLVPFPKKKLARRLQIDSGYDHSETALRVAMNPYDEIPQKQVPRDLNEIPKKHEKEPYIECKEFSRILLNNSIGKIEPCSMGDVDFIRGVYINSQWMTDLYKDSEQSNQKYEIMDDEIKQKFDIMINGQGLTDQFLDIKSESEAKVSASFGQKRRIDNGTPVAMNQLQQEQPKVDVAIDQLKQNQTTAVPTIDESKKLQEVAWNANLPAPGQYQRRQQDIGLAKKEYKFNYMDLALKKYITGRRPNRKLSRKRILEEKSVHSDEIRYKNGNDDLFRFKIEFDHNSGFNIAQNMFQNRLVKIDQTTLGNIDNNVYDKLDSRLLVFRIGLLCLIIIINLLSLFSF